MAKAGSVVQFILKQIFRSSDVNALSAELGAHPLIGHDETTGVRRDFDIGDPLSGTTGHIVNHIYQRFGYKIKTLDAAGVVVHTADVTAIPTIDIPVGGIIWWYKGLTGVPALPSGWVECNGQVLSDAESLLNGQTMPNINTAGRFIRGSATAGTTQSSQNLQHAHTNSVSTGLGSLNTNIGVSFSMSGFGGNSWGQSQSGSPTYQTGLYGASPGYLNVSGALTIGVSQGMIGAPSVVVTVNNSGSSEARPINISMVAIIRVK